MKALKELLDRPGVVEVSFFRGSPRAYRCQIWVRAEGSEELAGNCDGRSPLGALKRAIKMLENSNDE